MSEFWQELLNVIVDYWQYFAVGILGFINIILSLIKKKPIEVVSAAHDYLLKVVPGFIISAEQKFGSGNGSSKLDYVVQLALETLKSNFPGLDTGSYVGFIKSIVEIILSTPQKKGKSNEKR